jgi:hypothetical protein
MTTRYHKLRCSLNKRPNANLAAWTVVALATSIHHTYAVEQVGSPAGLIGALVVEDFEDSWLIPGVTYSSNSGVTLETSLNATSGVTTSGFWGLTTFNYPEPITMTFNRPTKAVGMYFGNDDPSISYGFNAYLDVYGSSGLQDTIVVEANMNDYVDQFLGFNSDTPVTSVTLRYSPLRDADLNQFIDDVQFAIPEPAGLVLALVAVHTVAFMYRIR